MFLAFSILAGFNGRFENYEPGKNIKIYDITGIVPAATDYSLQIKNAPKKGESVGRFDGKNYEARFIEDLPTGRVREARCLVYMLIVDHVFGNVHRRNHQSYFRDNSNYFSYFQKIIQKKL